MKALTLVLTLIVPFLALGQAQFVSFNPNESDLAIASKYSSFQLTFEVEPEHYIQPDQAQVSNEDLIASVMSLESVKGFSVCSIRFSKPQTTKSFGSDESIVVLDRAFTVQVEIETTDHILSGVYPIKGALYYQASNLLQCYPPQVLEFETQVEVILP